MMLLYPSSRRARVSFAVPVAAIALLALPPSGSAAGPPAAVDQYRESIPSGTGNVPDESSSHRSTTIILPSKVAVAITRRGGKDAHVLKKIVTSPTYSAPPLRSPGGHAPAPVLRPKVPSALSAAFGATGDRSFLLLVVPLGLATGATLAAAVIGRKRR